MADTITVTGNIFSISRNPRGCSVKATQVSGPIAENPNLIWPGAAVSQTNSSGAFNLTLGKGDYLLTVDDAVTPALAFSVTDTTPVNPVNILTLLTTSIVWTKGSPGAYFQSSKQLTAGATQVVFSGLTIPFTPTSCIVWAMAPDGSFNLIFTPIPNTLTSAGVTANISGIAAGNEIAIVLFFP